MRQSDTEIHHLAPGQWSMAGKTGGTTKPTEKPDVLLAPGEETDEQTEAKGNANGLIRTLANHFVSGFGTLHGFFLRALDYRFQVIHQSLGDLSSDGGFSG